jgi:DNA repair protein RecN (Recombination protein N)
MLRENGIADDEDIILRRVQFGDGRTRAFVNDQPVSAALLKRIGALVVEIHGQHDDRALVDVATHRELLDAFGGHEGEAAEVRARHAGLAAAEAAVAEQRALVAEAASREEYARHVVEELTELAVEAGEEESLAERRQHLMELERAAEEVREADELINGAAAPAPGLVQLMRRLSRKAEGGASVFSPLVEALDAALTALDRTSEALEDIKRDMAFDPIELERVEERLFALRGAARKHQVAVDELPGVLARYAGDLAMLESGEAGLAALEAASGAARVAYEQAADRLSEARGYAAADLARSVEAELPELKLAAARFLVDLQVDRARVATTGFDQVAFHVQTNPGTAAGPLLKIASGGELSRFLLALKVALADRGSAPVLVFDEIDTGVGGAVADAIGRRLARLAERVQVVTVTHAPQVAARAGRHLLIEKQAIEEGAFMRTHVRPLDRQQRQEEVARMLAGARVTEEARAAASRLIAEVQ